MDEIWWEVMRQSGSKAGDVLINEQNHYFGAIVYLMSSFLQMVCRKAMTLGLHEMIGDEDIAEVIVRIGIEELQVQSPYNGRYINLRDMRGEKLRELKEYLMEIAVCGWT